MIFKFLQKNGLVTRGAPLLFSQAGGERMGQWTRGL